MARLTKPLFGVPDGEVYPREIPAGEECPPELEAAARDADALESADERPKAEAKAATGSEDKKSKENE